MTERTATDAGALACPFVAFEDDRDERSERPDHRHRCYAEVRPAPRAIAHQEAFCLSGGFAACPTFQDWARRESARAHDAAAAAAEDLDEDDQPARNPPRDWAAPPPWVGDPSAPGYGSAAEPVAPAFLTKPSRGATGDDLPVEAAGLSASRWLDDGTKPGTPRPPDPDDEELERALAADRAARERLAAPAAPPAAASSSLAADPVAAAVVTSAAATPAEAATPVAPAGSTRRRGAPAQARPVSATRKRTAERDLVGPAWERPRRYEAYPTIKTRMGLPSVPRLALAGLAVLVAAGVLFFVPFLLKTGGDSGVAPPSATPTASAEASGDLPSAEPVPTVLIYTVKSGDTMSKIAKKYGVTVDQILAANKAIKNPNRIQPGDKLTIPAALPSEITNGGSPALP